MSFALYACFLLGLSHLTTFFCMKAENYQTIIFALCLTFAICSGVFIAAYTLNSLNYMSPALYILGTVTTCFAIFYMLFNFNSMNIWMLLLFISLFSVYLCVDIIFIIRGYSLFVFEITTVDDWMLGVIKLYLDIVGIFVTLLSKLSED